MPSVRILALLALSLSAASGGTSQAIYDPALRHWTLDNRTIRAEFDLTEEGYFRTAALKDLTRGDNWLPATGRSTSIIRFHVDNDEFDAQMPFQLVEQRVEPTQPAGIRQVIVLRDVLAQGEVTVNLELYDNQPVLRYWTTFRNLGTSQVHIKFGNMLSWTFADSGKRYTAFRVNQWSVLNKGANFQTAASTVDATGRQIEVYSGAHGEQCAWLAIRDTDTRGLFAGWEFDGRARINIKHSAGDGYIQLAGNIVDLYHPVAPKGTFRMPAAFLGLYRGDWDEAGYRTQRFVEAVLAKRVPESAVFPYVAWDSWGYHDKIDETALRREAEAASALGVELFIVDLGWSKQIGDWHADREKFPSGLRALSDYVHSLGMRFGLHFALAEAARTSPVLQANPDWTASESGGYYGAESLCLSNEPTREWLIAEGIRIIDTYGVDWILQDGENMVKQCTKSTHTHDPADSNYANSVEGLNYVVEAIQAARPNVLWENCEDGGNMMTFQMVRNYVTSITNDASGALSSRQAVFGATYPFPPRYTDRYMPAEGLTPYVTNSYAFGGPWVIMQPLTSLNGAERQYLSTEIGRYKAKRRSICSGKVFHITSAPAVDRIDVLQSYNPDRDEALAVVSRPKATANSYLLKPKGLSSSQRYRVWFENDSRSVSQTGAQLMRDGISVPLPTTYSSEVVHIEKQ
jgi:alpha-galactosidase